MTSCANTSKRLRETSKQLGNIWPTSFRKKIDVRRQKMCTRAVEISLQTTIFTDFLFFLNVYGLYN